MLKTRRVLWGEGMFLRPQHFQQQAWYGEAQLARSVNALQRHAWGVAAVELDHTALEGGQVRVDALDVRFRDGVHYSAPAGDPLPASRNLNDIPQAPASTLLYACLPDLHAHGGNVADDARPAGKLARYARRHATIADLYTGALDTELTTLDLNVQLRTAEENRDGFESVPLARLSRDTTGRWRSDPAYLPPLLTVRAHAALPRLLRRLLDILAVKSSALSATHRERATKVVEYASSDIASFWLLHTVNRNHARLNHLWGADPLHPEELYLALAELFGELVTFSRIHALTDLPEYRHEDLAATLYPLDDRIRELLDTVISTRYLVIPLRTPKPSFHIGHLEDERLLEAADFYLSVQSELPAAEVIESVPYKLKIGAPDDVEKILNSAIRGANLAHAAQTPSSVPVRVGNHYFAIEPGGELFQRMLQSRSVCIYVPQTLAALQLELIAVFR